MHIHFSGFRILDPLVAAEKVESKNAIATMICVPQLEDCQHHF